MFAKLVTHSNRHGRASHGASVLGPVIRSAVGVVRESAGLICNVAGLGIALVMDTRTTAPNKAAAATQTAAPRATNVILFPRTRNANRAK
jgi:hypothetical protein